MTISFRHMCWLVLLLVLPVAGQEMAHEAEYLTITHDGLERSYTLYTPPGEITQALVVLHPFGSNGRAMQIVTGLNAIADDYGIAIAYPDSADYYWDDGRVAAGVRPIADEIADVGFLTALADTLRSNLAIETVSLTGFENGGLMAYRVACAAPDTFANIIPVAAMMWDYQIAQCADNSPAGNLLIINGAEHPQYVPEGEDVEYLTTGEVFAWKGWQETVDFWRERNQCADSDILVTDQALTIYDDCANDTTISFWSISLAGYNWARMADNSLNRSGVDVSDVIASYLTGNDWQSLTEPEGIATSLARSWILYVPASYDPATPAPMVVNLHGRLSNAAMQAWASDFNTLAEEEGVIVLYPNGINTEWNYLLGLFEAGRDAHSDEAFLRGLLADLNADLNIDTSRIYVTGLSNGGFMTQRLACTMQDTFAAFASVAATAPFGLNEFCDERDPVPMMYIHGTADQIVPWAGSLVQDSSGYEFYISYPMEDSFNFWGLHNDCSNNYEIESVPQVDPETQTQILTLTDCADNSAIDLWIVDGGGHVWPGTRTTEYALLGENTQDFNGTAVIWEFFSQYTLPER